MRMRRRCRFTPPHGAATFSGFVAFSIQLSSPARSGLYHGTATAGTCIVDSGVVRLNCINDAVVVVVADLDVNSGVVHAPT